MMRSTAGVYVSAFHIAVFALLLAGCTHGGMCVKPRITLLAAAPGPAGGQQSSEEWIRDFERRRRRLLERLEDKMDELRRRLERNEGPRSLLASCG